MQTCFTNATVRWTEEELTRRDSLVREIPVALLGAWRRLNPAVQMERTETPVLTPRFALAGHSNASFPLIEATVNGNPLVLRPETTAGTYEAFRQLFPQGTQRKKRLPYCLWQVGLSFRQEDRPDTMRASKLRLTQFYQMEFQLFTSQGSMAHYLDTAMSTLVDLYGGSALPVEQADLPHYSNHTVDWYINGLEVAGCSVRKDWEDGTVFEVAIGLDRLVALTMERA